MVFDWKAAFNIRFWVVFFFISLLHLQLFADFIVCGGSSSSVELSSFKSVMDMRVVNVAKTISCTCDKYVVTGFACLGFGCSSTSLSLTHTHLFYFLLAPLSTDLRKMTKRSGSASKKKIFPFQQPVTCDKVSIWAEKASSSSTEFFSDALCQSCVTEFWCIIDAATNRTRNIYAIATLAVQNAKHLWVRF